MNDLGLIASKANKKKTLLALVKTGAFFMIRW